MKGTLQMKNKYTLLELLNNLSGNRSPEGDFIAVRTESEVQDCQDEYNMLRAIVEAAKLNDSCWLLGKWENNDRLAPVEARIELHNALASAQS